jgi:Ser/Thr protein kinase RdoA (MazF antagonist)
LHADLHQWNVRVHRGELSALDFDDTMIGHPVQDVAITFYYVQTHPEFAALRSAFQVGYENLRPWPVESEAQFETLLVWRALDLLNFVIYTDNPDIQQELPGFMERTEGRVRRFLTGDEKN